MKFSTLLISTFLLPFITATTTIYSFQTKDEIEESFQSLNALNKKSDDIKTANVKITLTGWKRKPTGDDIAAINDVCVNAYNNVNSGEKYKALSFQDRKVEIHEENNDKLLGSSIDNYWDLILDGTILCECRLCVRDDGVDDVLSIIGAPEWTPKHKREVESESCNDLVEIIGESFNSCLFEWE